MNSNLSMRGDGATSTDAASIVFAAPEKEERGGVSAPSPAPTTVPPGDVGKGGEGGELKPEIAAPPPLPPLAAALSETASEAAFPAFVGFTAEGVFTPAPKRNVVIAAIERQGGYVRSLGMRRHAVVCPWSTDHGDEALGEAVYTEPDEQAPYGRYHCPHQHQDRPTLLNLLDRLDIQPQRARGKPCIRVEAGEQNLVQAAAEFVLASRPDFFQSNGSIVAIRGLNGKGDVGMELVIDQALTMALSAAADWEKYDGRSKGQVKCDPPIRICQMLLKGQDFRFLREIKGIARQPFFRREDGFLVTQPGYDATSGIYARFDPAAFVLPEPTRLAAEVALDRLLALIDEFYFATDADRAAALCAMLTATVRSTLPLAPAFNVTAASSGSGKSYLTSTITPFAGSGDPFNMSYPTTSEEASKAMLAALIQAPAVIAFDDMQTDWIPHGIINRMLTSETVTDRLLGASKIATARTNSFVIGTGNNVSPVRDMCRRVVSIRLAPPSSAPSMLNYHGNPVADVNRDRPSYVVDALTIIRAWQAEGQPKADVPPIGSFGVWSDMCRQPLLWLGQADPAGSLMEQVKSDPDTRALSAFMEAWSYEFGEKPITVRKLIQTIESDTDHALAEAIIEMPFNDRQFVNPSKLGWFLKKNAERIIDGHVIRQVITPERRAWSVVKVESFPPSPPFDRADHKLGTDAVAEPNGWATRTLERDPPGVDPGEEF